MKKQKFYKFYWEEGFPIKADKQTVITLFFIIIFLPYIIIKTIILTLWDLFD